MSQPTERFIQSDDVTLRVLEMGEGPLVILTHGWPELAYSWRHQMPALAAAGYKVIAPDMRGYGGSSAPDDISDYTIQKLTGDIVNLIDAYGADKASLVGHDWGALVAWNAVLLHPERFDSLVAMSVPYGGRARVSPLDAMKAGYQDNFFYILYFQQPGVAEAEFDADPRGILSRLYASPDTPREPPQVTDPKMAAGGWIPRLGQPTELPAWLSQQELDTYVDTFTQTGFKGGINYYRNFDTNWASTPQLDGAVIDQPVLFLAGEADIVIRGASADKLHAMMTHTAPDLRVTLYPGIGHWVQQEAADEVNAALIDFLAGVER